MVPGLYEKIYEKLSEETKTEKPKVTRSTKIFVCVILTEELDPTQPLKKELERIKQEITKALNCERVMLQDMHATAPRRIAHT